MTGEEVVVKVQRPHIEQLVETDLAALRLAASWLKLYPPASRRVDLDRLYDEFSRTTRLELDFVQEGLARTASPPILRTTPASTSRMCSGRSRPAAC